MPPFDLTKGRFLLCLGLSAVVYLVIYLRNAPAEPPTQPQEEPVGCRPVSPKCSAFMPGHEDGAQWHCCDCQVENSILNSPLDCSNLTRDFHFITRPLSREEEEYPLAFIVTIHKELELFMRLLRAIYMPQNVYCIHVDTKSPLKYQEAVNQLVGCLPNVVRSSRSESVTYGGFSRLQADLNCMRDLVKSEIRWKKVVNLCGQDFPVKSNLELVRYLKSKEWRDRNMTPGVKQPRTMRHRTQLKHKEVVGSHVTPLGKGQRKAPPPHRLQVYFGTAYYALTREFVTYVLEDQVAKDLLKWSRDTFSPDEHYWVTLNHIQGAPGSHIDGGWAGDVRAIKWKDQEKTVHNGCKGHYVRDICIYDMEDLPWIINRNSMFANKFESASSPEALDCLEAWHRVKVLRQAAVPVQPAWLMAQPGGSLRSSYFNVSEGA